MSWDVDPDPLLLLLAGDECHLSGWLRRVATEFYKRVFSDPVLQVLFATRDSSHASRLASFLLMMCGGRVQYIRERCPLRQLAGTDEDLRLLVNPFDVVHGRHWQAQQNGARDHCAAGAGRAGEGFTTSQRDAWMRHMLAAVEEVVPPSPEFESRFRNLLERVMSGYGPFTPDRPDCGGSPCQEDEDEELDELLKQQQAFYASGKYAAASVVRVSRASQSVRREPDGERQP